jgi:hypothetical protein
VFGKADLSVERGVLDDGRPKPKTARRRFETEDMVEDEYLGSKGHSEKLKDAYQKYWQTAF